MPYNNSTNLFGTTPYVVGPSGSSVSYFTVQSAITAAAAAGGGVVYIRPGTYTENLTFATKVTLTSASGEMVNSTVASSNSPTIVGVHTFPAAGATVCASNIAFSAPASATAPVFSLAPSSGTVNLNLMNCFITATGTGTGITGAATGSGVINVNISSCAFNSPNSVLSAGAGVLIYIEGSLLVSSSTTAPIANVGAGSIVSSQNNYVGSTFANVGFSANGQFNTVNDTFSSADSSGYFIKSLTGGPFGVLFYGSASTLNSAISIDPTIPTQTFYNLNPDILPITNGQILIGRTGLAPALGTITAGSGVTVTNGSGTITIAAPPSGAGLAWNSITASQTLAVNNGYIVASGTLSLLLPATAVVGSVICIVLRGGTSFTITQAAGQQIFFGSSSTTAGTGGSIASGASGDSIELVCTTANTTWASFASIGNLLVT